MFKIGDKIFYPNHGAGVIHSIEEKEFLGEKHLYYVLNMLLKGLQIMVPVEKMSNLGIRLVVKLDTLDNVLAMFNEEEPDLTINSTQRHRINLDKLKRGDIYEGAEVIRDLVCIGKKKVLGAGDKMMLDSAREILLSELALVKGIEKEQASLLLYEAINN
ncbi:CarD family transcriptional regulator [Brevibacillus ginsengisoli]|uniref:CarD family transcriptional regulator n=1 Tax=Brevibacillus ginsengisoli TaxID=363854 RepID=UPI003CEF6406